MRKTIVVLALLASACGSERTEVEEERSFDAAQAIVTGIVAEHPHLVRLTIHAVPEGETESRIIACNVTEKLGKPSDPEDLETKRTKEPIVLKEGDHLDVTMPILDPAGEAIAATGITLSFAEGQTEADLVKEATAIAAELTTAVRGAEEPLW